jgi:hypothetical protein
MKRFGILAGGVLLAFAVAGCGGGIEEGSPKSGPMDPQTADLKSFMKQNAAKMQPKASMKNLAPKDEGGATPEKKGP